MFENLPGLAIFIFCTLISLAFFVFGFLFLETFLPEKTILEKLVLAYPVTFAYIYGLFLVNIVTSGAIFGHNLRMVILFAVPACTLLYLNSKNYRILYHLRALQGNRRYLLYFAILLIVYAYPIIRSPQGAVWIPGDMGRHMILINQIMNGSPKPHPVYPGLTNLYPWMFHVLTVFSQSFFLRETNHMKLVFWGYNVLSISSIIIAFLAMYSISRKISHNGLTQNAALFLGTFSGGLGFLYNTRFWHYHSGVRGDMVLGYSYNSNIMLVAPSWPRHLSYAIFLVFLYILLRFFEDENPEINKSYITILAVLLGQMALIQTVSFLLSCAVLFFIYILKLVQRDRKYVLSLMITILLAALYITPFLIPYLTAAVRYGADPSVTMQPYDYELTETVIALGQTFLLFPIGVIVTLIKYKNKQDSFSQRWVFNVFILVTSAVIGVSRINTTHDLGISFLTIELFRQHKFWHLLYPFLALLAAEGVTYLYQQARRVDQVILNWLPNNPRIPRIHVTASLFICLIIFTGISSPILTSRFNAAEVSSTVTNKEFIYPSENELMLTLMQTLGPHDVIASTARADLPTRILQFTGSSMMWVELYEVNLPGVFEHTTPQDERLDDLKTLLSNRTSVNVKRRIISKYNITHIVSPTVIKKFPTQQVAQVQETTFMGRNYTLYVLKRPDNPNT